MSYPDSEKVTNEGIGQLPDCLMQTFQIAEEAVSMLEGDQQFPVGKYKKLGRLLQLTQELQDEPSILQNPELLLSQHANTKLGFYFPKHPRKRLTITVKPGGITFSIEQRSPGGGDTYKGEAAIAFSEEMIRTPDGRSADNFSVLTHAMSGGVKALARVSLAHDTLAQTRGFFAHLSEISH